MLVKINFKFVEVDGIPVRFTAEWMSRDVYQLFDQEVDPYSFLKFVSRPSPIANVVIISPSHVSFFQR